MLSNIALNSVYIYITKYGSCNLQFVGHYGVFRPSRDVRQFFLNYFSDFLVNYFLDILYLFIIISDYLHFS